jgi:renalase
VTHPQHPKHLLGSKWTSHRVEDSPESSQDPPERHWEAVAFAAREGILTLEAVLTGRRIELEWRALRDRAEWEPGWASLAPIKPTTLVIGAGLAGLTCAARLSEAGLPVRVVDKARGAGGRASTRRAGALRFDHGAQYFTARDPRFQARVEAWAADGRVARWEGRLVRLADGIPAAAPGGERWVGVPKMSSLVKPLALEAGVEFGVRVRELRRSDAGWLAQTEAGASLGPFDRVVLATPAPQAAPLLSSLAPDLAQELESVEVAPCWAVMVEFATPVEVDWVGAQMTESPLSWVAKDSSKPGRPQGESWVLHASPGWSREHLEDSADEVALALLAALAEGVGALPEYEHLAAHRWRYARTLAPLGRDCVFEASLGLGVCGDYCRGERVEDAFLSGLELGEVLVASRSDATFC